MGKDAARGPTDHEPAVVYPARGREEKAAPTDAVLKMRKEKYKCFLGLVGLLWEEHALCVH